MGLVILCCRLLPFIFFADTGKDKNNDSSRQEKSIQKEKFKKRFLSFIEKTTPPVAMTVLAVREVAMPIKEAFTAKGLMPDFFLAILPVLIASLVCAILYLYAKHNALISIFGATIVFMVLKHIFNP